MPSPGTGGLIPPPSAHDPAGDEAIRAARAAAGLTQAQAGALIYTPTNDTPGPARGQHMKGINMTTLTEFIGSTRINPTLIRATVRQIGGWQAFRESAQDIMNHGAQSGFPGFNYYADTGKFFARQQAAIVELVETFADDVGETPIDLVQGFNGLIATESEVARTLYGTRSKHDTSTANVLSWFALEEIARAYANK